MVLQRLCRFVVPFYEAKVLSGILRDDKLIKGGIYAGCSEIFMGDTREDKYILI